MSSSTETDDDQCLDFGDVVVGFFVVQLMAQLDREWHDEYYRNVVAGLFVFQLMALHENEVLFGALDEEQGGEDGEDIEFHLPSLAGGGDEEESEKGMSPPKKRRKRGKGPLRQITRRRKTSKSTEEVTESEESLVSSSEDNAVSPRPKMTDRKAAWRNSPKGKSSIAESNKKYHLKNKSIKPRQQASKKYEASDKARSTRSRYETNEGAETRARYVANEGAETRARYEASYDGKETRKRYKSSQDRLETNRKYEGTKGALETRRRYKSSQGRLESQASYECSWKGLQTRIRYNSEIRDRSRYSLSFKQRTVSYKKRVKNAIQHLIARASETKPDPDAETGPDAEMGPHTKNGPPHDGAADQSREESVNPEPGAEKFLTNKNAMATIRSHKVGHKL